MSESSSLRDRYLELIDQIVQITLKGQIRSKEQVYQMLVEGISPGTGELFERCLGDRLSATKRQVETQTDEFQQAKASRSLRALQTIQGEWGRWQEQHQASAAVTTALDEITHADSGHRLTALFKAMDPNRAHPLNAAQLKQLAQSLQQVSTSEGGDEELQMLALGIRQGLESWNHLQDHLVGWIYDQQAELGFQGSPTQRGPWALWAKQAIGPLPRSLFRSLSLDQSLTDWLQEQGEWSLNAWVETAILLQYVYQGLVIWFDKLVYDSKVGAKLSISTFLAFAMLWSQLAIAFQQASQVLPSQKEPLTESALQVTLQILRRFSQQPYFPLYGGVYASFSGSYLRDLVSYLDEPLRRVEGTQEKARILTLVGFSMRVRGGLEEARSLHTAARELAEQADDRACVIANLNHLSRVCVAQKDYAEAINYSQRALVLSRQAGDRMGEANALANLGYSEVFQAQTLEQAEPEVYEMAISYLQQGLKLSERLGDRQSQALCLGSLGIAHLVLNQAQAAITYLEGGIQAAQFSGDLYLQGLGLAQLAEAYYQLQTFDRAAYIGSIAMYLLFQINANEWRQAAGLLTILQGQVGPDGFKQLVERHRAQIIAVIGVDGYDYLPTLLKSYRESS